MQAQTEVSLVSTCFPYSGILVKVDEVRQVVPVVGSTAQGCALVARHTESQALASAWLRVEGC